MRSSIVRHESVELGTRQRVERAPHPKLDGAVLRYCGYQHERAGQARRREVAQAQVTIIVGFGPALRVSGPSCPPADQHSFVAALHDSYAVTEESDALRGVQIDLSPLGARMLFGLPMHELSAHLVVPLEDVLGHEARWLVERLEGAPGWEERFSLLDSFIARRLSVAVLPSPDVAWAWRRLRETGGRLPIAALASELGCSNRHLVARFRDQVGPSPKAAARLLRFDRAIHLLQRDDGRRFAEIAQHCGYYDQAHLNRDFRELAGTTPGELVARLLPDGMGVAVL